MKQDVPRSGAAFSKWCSSEEEGLPRPERFSRGRNTVMRERKTTAASHRWGFRLLAALSVLGPAGAPAFGQGFSSGSTGADGALDLTGTPAGTTVEFNPASLPPRPDGQRIDPERDHVFHFTTITIPASVTLKMSAKWTNGPVHLLATGAVDVQGTMDLRGESGYHYTGISSARRPSVPGPGGYPGGVGARSSGAAQSGAGPGGGAGSRTAANSQWWGDGAAFVGSTRFLVPLLGGSGGGGGSTDETGAWAAGGGAGGGALLIASSGLISVGGRILADGGQGGHGGRGGCHDYFHGGSGSGGAIRLVAPLIQGSGVLSARGVDPVTGGCRGGGSGNGSVRLEAFQHRSAFTIRGIHTNSAPVDTFLPPPRSLRVVSIAGKPAPANPSGSFEAPDVVINSGSAVPVEIEAHYIPVGTVVKLHLLSLDAADQVVETSPLLGTLESSTATATVTFPPGFTRGYARAVWP